MKLFVEAVLGDAEMRILDVGGTPTLWESSGISRNVTLLNLSRPAGALPRYVSFVRGDARDLSRFPDGEFGAVFSNSVIEHVGGPEEQEEMAREVRRVGQRYFVQVPNYYFPVEPHFLFPGFQFAPRFLRRAIANVWPFGWHRPGSEQARHDAEAIRLLSCAELARLFPDAHIFGEALGPLNKALIAIRTPLRVDDSPGFRVLRRPVVE